MQPGQDLTTLTDEALLKLLAHSNKQALLVLFDRYAASLYTYILPLVRGIIIKAQDPADIAQVIVTDVFTTLWDNRKTVRIATTVRAHLFSAAYNGALEHGHHTSREQRALASPFRGKGERKANPHTCAKC